MRTHGAERRARHQRKRQRHDPDA